MISKNDNLKNFIKGLSAVTIYFTVSIFQSLPFTLMHINTNNLPNIVKILYTLSIEILIIFSIYLIFKKEIHAAIKDLKKNHLTYFKKYFKYYIIGLIVMMACNILIQQLGGGISENESTIRDEFKIFPIYVYISAVLLAPILEEFVFRLSFKAIFKNNYMYIIASGVIFGILHLLGMKIDNLFPLYLLSYCSSGISFAYMMAKSNNIFVSTGFHFMHNGLIMALQIFLLIFT